MISSSLRQSPADKYQNAICALGAKQLAGEIARRNLTATEVVAAYAAQIERVNPDLNALVVPLLDSAKLAAAYADKRLREGGVVGPLHGVPFTVKENFYVAGTPTTIGIGSKPPPVASEDAVLVKAMKQAGGILLGKTNVPQLMCWHECDNPVYGRTNNPWDTLRTPGGSSGGEAALISALGSPLGLGSELGGSIVVPAHFCGVCGLKPTARRLTIEGTRRNFPGMTAMNAQPGPMARRVEDLELAMRILVEASNALGAEDAPPATMRQPSDVQVNGLHVAIWSSTPYYPSSPAIKRAVNHAAVILKERGAIISDFQPPNLEEVLRMYFGILSADGGKGFRRLLGNSTVDRRVARILSASSIPAVIRPVIAWFHERIGDHRLAKLITWSGGRSAGAYADLCEEVKEYRQQFVDCFNARPYDAMLCPAHALPAFPHGIGIDLMPAACHTFLINLVGLPTGVLPITRVRDGEETERAIADRGDTFAVAAEKETVGMPVGVQVVARHWREDVVLGIMAILEKECPAETQF